MVVFLSDFNKQFSDVIKKKKYNFHRSLELNADKSNVMSWTAKTTVDPKGASNSEVVFTQKEKGLGELKCTFKSPDSMELEAKSKETMLTDLKCKVTQDVAEFTGEYAKSDKNWALKTKVVSKSSYSMSTDFAMNVGDSWAVGANANVTNTGLNDFGVGVRYMSTNAQHFSVQATNQLNNVCISGSLAKTEYFGLIGAQVDLAKVQSNAPVSNVTLGGLMNLDDRANLRWRMNMTKKNLALAYEYKFANNVKGCFSSSFGSDMKMTPLGMKFEVSL